MTTNMMTVRAEIIKNHRFSMGFKHIANFDVILTYTILNGAGATSTFLKNIEKVKKRKRV